MVVTAAGVAYSAATHQTSLEDWRLVTDINLTGTFITCKAVAPHMLAQGAVSRPGIAAIWVAFFSSPRCVADRAPSSRSRRCKGLRRRRSCRVRTVRPRRG